MFGCRYRCRISWHSGSWVTVSLDGVANQKFEMAQPCPHVTTFVARRGAASGETSTTPRNVIRWSSGLTRLLVITIVLQFNTQSCCIIRNVCSHLLIFAHGNLPQGPRFPAYPERLYNCIRYPVNLFSSPPVVVSTSRSVSYDRLG